MIEPNSAEAERLWEGLRRAVQAPPTEKLVIRPQFSIALSADFYARRFYGFGRTPASVAPDLPLVAPPLHANFWQRDDEDRLVRSVSKLAALYGSEDAAAESLSLLTDEVALALGETSTDHEDVSAEGLGDAGVRGFSMTSRPGPGQSESYPRVDYIWRRGPVGLHLIVFGGPEIHATARNLSSDFDALVAEEISAR